MSQSLKGEFVLSLARTFIARGIAALGSLLLMLVLGRLYGPSGVGVFALGQGIYLGAGILARLGMDNALMRYVGQDPLSTDIKRYLRWAVTRSSFLSLLAGMTVFLLRDYFSSWFDAPMLASVLPGIAIAIPAFTISFLLAGFMKGVRKPASACLLENGSISLFAAGFILLLNTVSPLGISNAGWGIALAAWLVLGQGICQVWRWFGRQGEELTKGATPAAWRDFAASSRAFFVLSLSDFMQQVLSVVIAGMLLDSGDLGLFKAAERTALLIMFILMVINAVLPPRFASLYQQGDWVGLNSLARRGALIGISLAFPFVLVCLIMPQWLLTLYGVEFSHGANLLRIIALAQFINVATGSVGFLLNMTGHERLMRNVGLTCNALGLILFFILTKSLGVLGAALGLALMLVVQNLTGLVFVWRKLGIWMLPFPNFLSWMSICEESSLSVKKKPQRILHD